MLPKKLLKTDAASIGDKSQENINQSSFKHKYAVCSRNRITTTQKKVLRALCIGPRGFDRRVRRHIRGSRARRFGKFAWSLSRSLGRAWVPGATSWGQVGRTYAGAMTSTISLRCLESTRSKNNHCLISLLEIKTQIIYKKKSCNPSQRQNHLPR